MSQEKKVIILIILAIVIVVSALIFLEKTIEKRSTEAKVAEIVEKENQSPRLKLTWRNAGVL